jgi:hypothetical protein
LHSHVRPSLIKNLTDRAEKFLGAIGFVDKAQAGLKNKVLVDGVPAEPVVPEGSSRSTADNTSCRGLFSAEWRLSQSKKWNTLAKSQTGEVAFGSIWETTAIDR